MGAIAKIYRIIPFWALPKVESKHYHGHVKRDAAYEKLLSKLRENERNLYNKNTLCKRVMASKLGTGAAYIYEPKLLFTDKILGWMCH